MTITEKNQYQAQLFSNRLAKNYKQLKKWARKGRVSCYRLYDRDIPEVPLAVDLYTFLPYHIDTKMDAARYLMEFNTAVSANTPASLEMVKDEQKRTYLHIYLYERPYEKDDAEEAEWLEEMKKAAAQTLNIDENNVILKLRRKQSGDEEAARNQYEKIETTRQIKGLTQEQGQLFTINLTDYIDTGLFFDHRPMRDMVRKSCSGKSVLNLFCYTGSFSVYAAEGNARRVQSVDMSKTYIEWAKDNMAKNEFTDEEKYIFTRQDAVGFLNQMNAEVANADNTNRYDIIILDPPTFSNSKRTDTTLDINRDWPSLVEKCMKILNPKGTLYFSTNSRRLSFNEELLPSDMDFTVEDITAKTIPEDYRNNKIHRAWKICLK